MKKEKVFILIIAVLIIVNIATLAMLLCKDGGKNKSTRNSDRMKNYLIKEIGFSESQMASYDSLYTIHQKNNESNMKQFGSGMDANLKTIIASNFSDSVIDVTSERMANSRKLFAVQMFKHVGDIRALCTTDQLTTFDTTIHKMFKKRKPKNDK